MRQWHVVLVAIGGAILAFICMILAPDTTLWPAVVLSSPALLLCMRVPWASYPIVYPLATAGLFAGYASILIATRGRARLVAALLIALFHAACAVATALLLPNPLY